MSGVVITEWSPEASATSIPSASTRLVRPFQSTVAAGRSLLSRIIIDPL